MYSFRWVALFLVIVPGAAAVIALSLGVNEALMYLLTLFVGGFVFGLLLPILRAIMEQEGNNVD